MDNSSIEDTLDEALEQFRHGRGTPEPGLDVDNSALLQLRKSCRLLEAVETLRDRNGYYTVVIEASFAAIERTLQFYLLEEEYLTEEEYVDHHRVYELGETAGLYGPGFRDKLTHLWENNRSRTYYREGVGTRQTAELILELARGIHRHVLQLAGWKHECTCENE